jgi:hypothetical protein
MARAATHGAGLTGARLSTILTALDERAGCGSPVLSMPPATSFDPALRLNAGHLRFARACSYIPAMNDLAYWTNKLKEAERELAPKDGGLVPVARPFQ